MAAPHGLVQAPRGNQDCGTISSLSIGNIHDYPARRATTGEARPLVSIITTVWNGAAGLQRTIDSVAAQDAEGIEYIIVDGGSTDGTLDIVRANAGTVTHWQSEPDKGISDGFNKGIALSRGRYVTLIHADDWLSPGQLRQGISTLEKTGADFVFGDLIYYRNDTATYRMRGEANYADRIGHVMPALNHPTVIVRRSAYERHGLFDTSYKLAMDYELLLRFHRAGLRGVYDPLLIGNMALDGASDRSSKRALAEVRRASIAHGYSMGLAWFLYGFRVFKDSMRRLSETYMPPALHDRLRKRANQNFAGLK